MKRIAGLCTAALLVSSLFAAACYAAGRGRVTGPVTALQRLGDLVVVTVKGEGPWQAVMYVRKEASQAFGVVSSLKLGDRATFAWTQEDGRYWVREVARVQRAAARDEGEHARAEGERDRRTERRDAEGDQHDVEGDQREIRVREGDRHGEGDREVKRDADRERREGDVRREGGDREVKREGDRQRREGDIIRDGDRPAEVKPEANRDDAEREGGDREGD